MKKRRTKNVGEDFVSSKKKNILVKIVLIINWIKNIEIEDYKNIVEAIRN